MQDCHVGEYNAKR